VVVAYDEFTPGNAKLPKNPRKTMVVAFSFAEFGDPALSDERAWFTVATVRSTVIEKVVGGWSYMLRRLLKHMFVGDTSMANTGAALSVRGRATMLFARLKVLLSDNDGLKMGLNIKGYGSLRPCLRCYNVWMKGKAPAGHVDITCADEQLFQPLARETLREYIETLREARARRDRREMSKVDFDHLEKALGINCDLNGLLFDAELNATIDILDVLRTDWMHGELSHGALTNEVADFLVAVEQKEGMQIKDWKEVAEFTKKPKTEFYLLCLLVPMATQAVILYKICFKTAMLTFPSTWIQLAAGGSPTFSDQDPGLFTRNSTSMLRTGACIVARAII
jgi:hypothetical protein